MDNVTHSLFGYALARVLPKPASGQLPYHSAFMWTSVLASNVPDLDLLLRLVADDPKLAYLMHHRGHTHTVVWAIPLGVAVAYACARAHRIRAPREIAPIVGVGVLAVLFHLAFDALNNYGVHPFYPFDNRWYYGDFVFIVEPLLLAALVPMLFSSSAWLSRGVGAVLVATLAYLLVGTSLLTPVTAYAMLFVLLAAAGVAARLKPPAYVHLGVVAAVASLYFATGRIAEAYLQRDAQAVFPRERFVDIVRTPYPGNPVCWSGVTVSVDHHGVYRVRKAALSLLPTVVSAPACPLFPKASSTAPLAEGRVHSGPMAVFGKAFAAPLAELGKVKAECRGAGALTFMRAPFWATVDGKRVVGDLRYDREPGLGFAEVPLEGSCSDPIPPWIPPRSDLLSALSGPEGTKD